MLFSGNKRCMVSTKITQTILRYDEDGFDYLPDPFDAKRYKRSMTDLRFFPVVKSSSSLGTAMVKPRNKTDNFH